VGGLDEDVDVEVLRAAFIPFGEVSVELSPVVSSPESNFSIILLLPSAAATVVAAASPPPAQPLYLPSISSTFLCLRACGDTHVVVQEMDGEEERMERIWLP
jgi:hypothetical protein